MNILHIASIKKDPHSGVAVVTPEHVKAQGRIETVSFLNVTNERFDEIDRQLEYKPGFSFREIKIDLAVFHEVYRLEYIDLFYELRCKSIPYIIIPHGELSREAQRKKWLKKKLANLLLFDQFIDGAAALQMLSERELESTHRGKVKFVGTNGINIQITHKESFGEDNIRLIYIGRLDVYHKGLDILLDAIFLSRDIMKRANCSLDIYGPDHRKSHKRLMNMIGERGISDVVTIHRAVSGEEKERVLMGSDIFIQTSRFEGMPMGILEALGYGLPCILTDGTTLADLVKNNAAGFGCKTNGNDVARAIEEAIRHKGDFMKLSENARKLISRDFSWNHVARECVKSYKKILGRLK